MNYWKPLALCSIAGLVTTLGVQTARAGGGPCHDQPNMAMAVTRLKEARAALEKAEHNKGGWRVAAIQATDNAIKEADRGCNMADEHH
jgi:hypothetical protein